MVDNTARESSDQPALMNGEATVDSAAEAIAALLNRPGGTADPDEAQEEAAPAEPQPVEAQAEEVEAQEQTPEPIQQDAPKPAAASEPKAEAPKPASEPPVPASNDQLAQLTKAVMRFEAALEAEYGDIKSFSDLQKLMTDNVQRYNQYVLAQHQLQAAKGEQQRLFIESHNRFQTAQIAELKRDYPDYIDEVKGPALRKELTDYARKMGYDDARMLQASAKEIVTLNKALQWDKLQAQKAAEPAKVAQATAQAKAKAAKAPPVQRPGVVQESDRNQRAADSYSRLQRTGSVDDAAAVLRQILG